MLSYAACEVNIQFLKNKPGDLPGASWEAFSRAKSVQLQLFLTRRKII